MLALTVKGICKNRHHRLLDGYIPIAVSGLKS